MVCCGLVMSCISVNLDHLEERSLESAMTGTMYSQCMATVIRYTGVMVDTSTAGMRDPIKRIT